MNINFPIYRKFSIFKIKMNDHLAQRTLFLKNPNEKVKEVILSIGHPYKKDDDTWACGIGLTGLYPNLADVCGEDSFQALMLAQKLAKTLLIDFVDKGGKIYSDEDHEVDVNILFQSGI